MFSVVRSGMIALSVVLAAGFGVRVQRLHLHRLRSTEVISASRSFLQMMEETGSWSGM